MVSWASLLDLAGSRQGPAKILYAAKKYECRRVRGGNFQRARFGPSLSGQVKAFAVPKIGGRKRFFGGTSFSIRIQTLFKLRISSGSFSTSEGEANAWEILKERGLSGFFTRPGRKYFKYLARKDILDFNIFESLLAVSISFDKGPGASIPETGGSRPGMRAGEDGAGRDQVLWAESGRKNVNQGN
jgi:hypothetical protein